MANPRSGLHRPLGVTVEAGAPRTTQALKNFGPATEAERAEQVKKKTPAPSDTDANGNRLRDGCEGAFDLKLLLSCAARSGRFIVHGP
jgi:hypothetical protein